MLWSRGLWHRHIHSPAESNFKPHISECLCTHSNRINSTKIQQKVHGRILFMIIQCMLFFASKQSIFTLCANLVSNCFCLWGKTEKKWELLSQERKETQQQIFQGTMATEHSKEFWWEQQAKRGWLQGRQFVTPIARATESDCTHTCIVPYSLSGPLCKNSVLFCPIMVLHSEHQWERRL